MVNIAFHHYSIELPDEILSRFGSRYYPRTDAGKEVRKWLINSIGDPEIELHLPFDETQVKLGNEAFPEAALADPLADLEVWDEWQSGLRRFPYPGVYTRLNIFHQEKKTSATSNIGVLGEIFTGLFSQNYVGPLVVVRPIRRWPDFIFLGLDGRYSFVESKATASVDSPKPIGIQSIREKLLGEGLIDAVQELNAEPLLRVWLCFTDIISVQPTVSVNVCVIELEAPKERQDGRKPIIPDAIVEGLAQQLIVASAAEIEPEYEENLFDIPKVEQAELWQKITDRALERTEQIIPMSVPEGLQEQAAEYIRSRIKQEKRRKIKLDLAEGSRLTTAKSVAARGTLATIRQVPGTGKRLMLADLPPDALELLCASWQPNWKEANQPWGEAQGLQLWRCSSAVFGLGGKEHENLDLREARQRLGN